jgi:hypothetical protein
LRKTLAFVGFILVLLGISMFVVYNLPQESEKLEYKQIGENKLIDKVKWEWEIPWENMTFEWNFLEGEEIIVAVWPYYDWAVPSAEPETGMYLPPNSSQYFSDVKRLRVNVTNLDVGRSTLIEIYYPYNPMKPGTPSPFSEYFGVPIDTGALNLNEGYPKAGVIGGKGVVYLGKAKATGAYRITFSMEPADVLDETIDGKLWPHPISPPYMLRLYKRVKGTIYPYRSVFILPAGVSLMIVGGIVFWRSRKPSGRHISIKNLKRFIDWKAKFSFQEKHKLTQIK